MKKNSREIETLTRVLNQGHVRYDEIPLTSLNK